MRYSRNSAVTFLMVACFATVSPDYPIAPAYGQQEVDKLRPFPNGLPADPSFFPVAAWLQQPRNAAAFKAIGINTFVGLWSPPTLTDLAQLRSQAIYLIVEPTPQALALKDSPVIRGWMHVDEPDNAQPDGKGGHGDCILAPQIIQRYEEMRSRDATRPVYLGFGQAVANPYWFGRGPRCSAIAPRRYYTEASRGADIVAFDIYPVAETRQTHVMGRLDLVGRGVRNLKRWAPTGTPVWAYIETTHIGNPSRRPIPKEIYSEVWIAIVNGAAGIIYFVHEWKPSFREDGVFRYDDTIAMLTRLNRQILELAPVLNSPTVENAVDVAASTEMVYLAKRDSRALYLFVANMENRATKARVSLRNPLKAKSSVLGEERNIELIGDAFEDTFESYGVHIYKLERN